MPEQTEHAPGPWRWTRSYEVGDRTYWCLENDDSTAEGRTIDGALVLRLDRNDWLGESFFENPNARLIAAAPDLLTVAELGYQLSTWAACINWRGGENQKEWLDDLRRKIEEFQPLAEAAIAKAKGEK